MFQVEDALSGGVIQNHSGLADNSSVVVKEEASTLTMTTSFPLTGAQIIYCVLIWMMTCPLNLIVRDGLVRKGVCYLVVWNWFS